MEAKHEEYGILDPVQSTKIIKIEIMIREQLKIQRIAKIEIGKLLYEIKNLLPHGKFQNWIENNFGDDLPFSSANRYQKIYELFAVELGYEIDHQIYKEFEIGFLYMITQKKFPVEARKIILSEQNDEERISDLKDGYVYPIKHTPLGDVEHEFKKYKDGDLSEEVFIKFIQTQNERGKQIQSGKKEEAVKAKNESKVYKMRRLTDTISKNLNQLTKLHSDIQSTVPLDMLADDLKKVLYDTLDVLNEKIQKIKEDLKNNQISHNGIFCLAAQSQEDNLGRVIQ